MISLYSAAVVFYLPIKTLLALGIYYFKKKGHKNVTQATHKNKNQYKYNRLWVYLWILVGVSYCLFKVFYFILLNTNKRVRVD